MSTIQAVVRTPGGSPRIIDLKPGENVLGRLPENELPIDDNFASRRHAVLVYDPLQVNGRRLLLRDLGSSNGTYLNQRRVAEEVFLQVGDAIRIGRCLITFSELSSQPALALASQPAYKLHATRELLATALDRNAVLLSEVARQLNTVLDLRSALLQVSEMMKKAMAADRCAVILPERFEQVDRLGFPRSLAQQAIEQRSTVVVADVRQLTDERSRHSSMLRELQSALCVPILNGEDLLGLILLSKNTAGSLPFGETDLELAVAISHQAALTIQRMRLIADLRQEQQVRNLLRRFVAPAEAGELFEHYRQSGEFPPLTAAERTVLFADIADSTRMAEQLNAELFADFLQGYYSSAIRAVFDQRGIIKLLGDGVMATFGPQTLQMPQTPQMAQIESADDYPEVRAVRAGLALVERIRRHNELHPELPIVVGVGIVTGLVVSGYVGSQDWVEYTSVGDPVNIAARLQQFARPNRVVVDARTAARITPLFGVSNLGEVEIRGRERGLRIFEVGGADYANFAVGEAQVNTDEQEWGEEGEDFFIR